MTDAAQAHRLLRGGRPAPLETTMSWLSSPDLWWWLLAVALIAVGIAGTVLPALPGVVFVFGGIALGAWIDDFTRVSGWTVAAAGVLAVVALLIDFVAGLLGAQRAGASPAALWGAAIGTVAGVFTGLLGLLFMPLVGAAAGEIWAQRARLRGGDLTVGGHATRVGIATWIGMLVGTVVKLALAFVMVGVFVAALLI
jgi:uncharacterized protein